MAVSTTYEINPLGSAESASAQSGSQSMPSFVQTDDGRTLLFYRDINSQQIVARSIGGTFFIVPVANDVKIETDQSGHNPPVSVAKMSNGSIVVTWAGTDGNIYFRFLDQNLNPLSSATLAETSASTGSRVDVAGLAGGGFVLVWQKDLGAQDGDVVYRRFDASGVGLDSGAGVNVRASVAQDDVAPSVAALNDGGFAIGFSERNTTTGNTSMLSATYNANGSVRSAASVIDAFGDINRDVEVVARSDGGFILLYEDSGWSGTTITDVTAARFNASGVFNSYIQVTLDTVNNRGAAAAVSPDGFILAVQDQANATTDFTATLLSSTGNVLVRDVSLFNTDHHENSGSVIWTSPSTFRVAVRDNMATGADPDTGVTLKDFSVARRSDGDALANTIAQAGDQLNDIMSGGGGNDVLITGRGNDVLFGDAGSDEMYGGLGDDTYYVEDNLDSIIELAGEGFDTVRTMSGVLSFTLPSNVEYLHFDNNQANQTGVGNALDNSMSAVGEHATLIGLGGNDVLTQYDVAGIPSELIGGPGNDSYSVYNRFTSTIELPGEGIDTVYTNHSIYQLQANVENLRYLDNGTHGAGVGNALDNTLTGGTGQDDLFGREGNDTIYGGTVSANTLLGQEGNDVYHVTAVGDSVIEFAAQGEDIVYAYVPSFTLPNNVENLIFSGVSGVVGVGNSMANIIQGSTGADSISGLAGNDFIIGGSDADTLQGGADADQFRYAGGETGYDRILDFQPGIDKIALNVFWFTPTATVGFVQSAGAVALDPVSTFLHNTANGILYYDDDGTGPGAAVALAQINLGQVLSASDFIFF